MRFNLLLTLALILQLACTALAASPRYITAAESKSKIDKGAVFLLDVRTPEEYRQGHLRGSVLIPLDQVERRLGEIPRNRPVLIYCAVGSRSGAAAGFLSGKGYRDVMSMSDGIVGWYRNGYPLER
jgi:rhodanese-related sulfurtransferase